MQSGTAGYLHLSTAVPDWIEDHHLYNSTRSTTLCNIRGVIQSHSKRSIDHQLENESYINLIYTVVDRYVSKQLRGVITSSKFFLIYRILTSRELTSSRRSTEMFHQIRVKLQTTAYKGVTRDDIQEARSRLHMGKAGKERRQRRKTHALSYQKIP